MRTTVFFPIHTRVRRQHPATLVSLFLGLAVLTSYSSPLDTDNDGLLDTWELKHFGSLGHLDGDPADDPDGDMKSNLDECLANTDPNDGREYLKLVDSNFDPAETKVSWTSVFAKKYRIDVTGDLQSWNAVEKTSGSSLGFRGTGGVLTADFSDPANPLVTGAVTRKLYLGLAGGLPSDLNAHFAGLGAPDAVEWHPRAKGPSNQRDNYSAIYSGCLIPKSSGDFTFYVASRGPSQFWLSTDDSPSNFGANPICSLATNDLPAEEDWTHDPSQQSASRALVAGQKYYFEIRHVHDTGTDHVAVGWQLGSGPIEIIPGDCLSPSDDLTSHNAAALFNGTGSKFIRVLAHGPLSGEDYDTDLDGVDDATEADLAGFGFDPYAANSSGGDDMTALASLLAFNPAVDKEEVLVEAIDDEAVENTSPPLLPGNIVDLGSLGSQSGNSTDTITFRLRRTKSLLPLNIFYTLGGNGSGEEPAATNPTDYTALEGDGGAADDILAVPAFESGGEIVITVKKDNIHEYPEKIECQITTHADYDIAPGMTIGKAEIVDMPSSVNILFVGAYEKDFNAVNGSTANGSVSGYLKGDKRKFVLRNDNFGNLSSPQIDTHFHKIQLSGLAETGGPPIHDILNTQGTDALLGHYLTYEWDLTHQNPVTPAPGPGIPSRQVVVDSLFNQNGQTQIYINLHTDENAGGETMARLAPASGSVNPPNPPAAPPAPGDPGFEMLAGADLEREIVRFLNQATFGAAWEDVQAIKTAIESERSSGNPNYHRVEEFEKWIEDQCKMDQTFILDYTLALDCLEFNLRGLWDPDEWLDWSTSASNPNSPGAPDVEPVPGSLASLVEWPTIDRSLTNGPAPGMPSSHPHFWANQWFPSGRYPTDSDWYNWMDDSDKTQRNLGGSGPQYRNRRRAHWMMMVNANDQLRHKWGYAIQQIMVVAETLSRIRDRHYPSANYQDMLNYYGLPSDRDGSGTLDANEQVYFRNLLGWVNWNPLMGYWLSSLRNRAAYDSNNDGIIDVFPDENLAREDMQLFSIGLFNLWPDGSLQLTAASNPNIPPGSSATYDNDDIQEFARIITGLNISRRTPNGRSDTIGWDDRGFREGPYAWGIDTTGPWADKGEVFDTDNTNDTGVGGDDADDDDGDDGIVYNTSFTNGSTGDRFMGHEWNYPMRMFGRNGSGSAIYHDLGAKTIAGGRLVDNRSLLSDQTTPEDSTDESMIAMGVKDYEDALDWFAGKIDGNAAPDFTGDAGNPAASHASTPPFISRRLIQRMVTSNPSSAYLYRVSNAFKNSEGNMLEVCKAVLLDVEARSLGNIDNAFGMKKSPLEAYLHVLRTFEAHSLLPIVEDPSLPPFSHPPHNGNWPTADGGYDPGTYPTSPFPDPNEIIYASEYGYPASQADNFRLNCLFQYPNVDSGLSMSPFAQETVFNYYLPDYSSGVVQSAALVAPELQLATETEVVRNHNYFWTILWQWDTGRSGRYDGQDVEELAGSNYNQREAFGVDPSSSSDVDHHERVRIDFVRWANLLYNEGMVDAGGRTANSLEAEDLVDKIDLRLTGGSFKARYPYNEADDDSFPWSDWTGNPREPTAGDGNPFNDVDARNPREWIIRAVAESYGDGDTEAERRDKFRLALYLFAMSPEFQVKK